MQDSTRRSIFIVLVVVLAALVSFWWYSGFSLDFMKFFAAEPETPSPTVSTTVTPSGPVSCTVSAPSVKADVQVTFTATGGSGAYSWFAPEGSPATGSGSSFAVSYSTVGTKQVTVESQRSDAEGAVDSVACSVLVIP